MSFTTGSSKDSWHPVMTADTTVTSYWLNWRFLLCGIWVVIVIVFSSLIIWKNEDCGRKKGVSGETKLETERTLLYEDETWRPCLKGIHPAWLLAFRVSSFFVLVVLLAIATVVDGSSIFYYYTQWTFILVTFYFGLGSLFSMYGCYQYHKRVGGDKVDNVEVDAEQGTSAAPAHRQAAGKWAYLFQIIFQMNAGAVLLTDCVFWFILVPLLEIKDYNINPVSITCCIKFEFTDLLRGHASPMLRHFRSDHKAETHIVFEMVSRFLSVFKIVSRCKTNFKGSVKKLALTFSNREFSHRRGSYRVDDEQAIQV
ncbi:hypothetical protein HS088_TW19G00460 [Tripterygium wilfordii]|uniref:Uncharacterized protein n=1 Tax=Tripterygium wilfordii TaxID=458696 RepID=A0A7J7C9T5_TRIWF|nr:hypothetical protein HS088_TW19G00460 [Tripterygium wilfordii]